MMPIQIVGLFLIVGGIVLILLDAFIFRITRSKRIGALSVVVVLLALCLIFVGLWVLFSPQTFSFTNSTAVSPANSTMTA